jgi:D-serine deaminase-like pyridoxal phosphate-dependent protein
MPLGELATPVPVVDLDRMQANIARVAEYARAHGLALRPHVKTHKSLRVARDQLAHGATGLTCATLREAEVMREVTDDLLIAYPPIGAARLSRLAALAARSRLRVMLDSIEAIDGLAAALAPSGATAGVLVELDLGMRRVGVATPTEAVTLARRIAAVPTLEWLGVGFYPGHIRGPVEAQSAAIDALNWQLYDTLDALATAGLPVRVVSGGSTPALWQSHRVAGITEIRPGTSVYNDRTTAEIGACALADCALTVLATVISVAVPGQAVVDAGTKALGREPIRGVEAPGYGVLLDRPDVVVSALSEEHGTLDLSQTTWRPALGEQVRIIPNHVCIVTHLFDRAVGVRDDQVIEEWLIEARGR